MILFLALIQIFFTLLSTLQTLLENIKMVTYLHY